MSKINIKIMNEEAILYAKKNAKIITNFIKNEDTNEWVATIFRNYNPLFQEKKLVVDDFSLESNLGCVVADIDIKNSITLYESLKDLPNYILCNEGFWMWLEFDKLYNETKEFMEIKSESTFLDHWTFNGSARRGIFFGVLSRMFYRVALSVDERKEDKYELTRWIIEKPERFRNLTWRTYSSEKHLVRGILRAEKKFAELYGENNKYYVEVAKIVSMLGSVKLLDAISEEDIENMVFEKMCELNNSVEE